MPRWETAGEVTRCRHDRFEWRVEDRYFLTSHVDAYVGSPTFVYLNSLWYFTKWPYGWAGHGEYNWVGLSLCGTSSQSPVLNVKLGMKRADGGDLKSSKGKTSPYGCFEDPRYLRSWQIEKRRTEVSVNGFITVFCEVRTEGGNELMAENIPAGLSQRERNAREDMEEIGYFPHETDELPLSEGEEPHKAESAVENRTLKSKSFDKLLLDLKDLWLSEEDSDVRIKVQGQELPAHRNILRARCPVFHSMFKHEMVEQTSGVVEIDDCDPGSFRDFLLYIYTGRVENLSADNVFSLFAAADKYCVQELREDCLEFIRRNVSLDTFCDTMILSLRYSETELLEKATDFFSKNMAEILVTEAWEAFLHENTSGGNKLLIKALIPRMQNGDRSVS